MLFWDDITTAALAIPRLIEISPRTGYKILILIYPDRRRLLIASRFSRQQSRHRRSKTPLRRFKFELLFLDD
jgi:hypothetical protein